MPNSDDFLDQLPTKPSAPATKGDDDMDQVVQAAAPTGKKLVKRLVRRVQPAAPGAATAPARPSATPARPVLPSLPPAAEATEEELPASEEELPVEEAEASNEPQPDNEAGDELQTLPMPTTSRVVPRPAAKAPSTAVLPVAVSAGPVQNVNQRWDEFLLQLEQATLLAVWELGIQSLTEFSTYSLDDLMKPRGRLTKAQAVEVRDKLASFGVLLSTSSRGGELRQGGNGQTRIRGLRAPARDLPQLPADATTQQRRQHRILRNRLTM